MANVFGTDSPETLNALDGVTNGADTIFGFGGDDTIFGLGGNDEIKGGGGADAINGGSGTDTANYSDSASGVTVSLETNQGFGGTAEGDTLTSIENLTGSAQDDFLIGNAGNNVLVGLEDNDILKGGGGSDTLFGDSGNDILKGGGGADTLNGGSGIDTANYAESSAAVAISLITDAAGGGDAEGDELNSIVNVSGSAHDDVLIGNDGTNVLRGNDGDDLLKGFGGADTLWGGDDNDDLFGMDGVDTLRGENGHDNLDGGAGSDTMIGGLGNDDYVVDSVGDMITEAAGQGIDLLEATTAYSLAPGVELEIMIAAAGAPVQVDLAGNEFGQVMTGNSGVNVLSGNGGVDFLDGLGGDDHLIGGAGTDTLTGGFGNDTFVFTPGHAHGDTIVDFTASGDAVGDVLVFQGYGPGATFTQIDATHWQVNYNGGANHDVITFLNGGAGAVHPSDLLFI